MASPRYAPRLNSWVTAAFALLFGLTFLVWLLGPSLIDQGAPLGPYAGTAWELVYAWVTLPAVGELVIAYIADRLVRERVRKKAKRAPGLLGALATAAGVLDYAVLFVAAIPIARRHILPKPRHAEPGRAHCALGALRTFRSPRWGLHPPGFTAALGQPVPTGVQAVSGWQSSVEARLMTR